MLASCRLIGSPTAFLLIGVRQEIVKFIPSLFACLTTRQDRTEKNWEVIRNSRALSQPLGLDWAASRRLSRSVAQSRLIRLSTLTTRRKREERQRDWTTSSSSSSSSMSRRNCFVFVKLRVFSLLEEDVMLFCGFGPASYFFLFLLLHRPSCKSGSLLTCRRGADRGEVLLSFKREDRELYKSRKSVDTASSPKLDFPHRANKRGSPSLVC